MTGYDLVVIGTSAGGLAALCTIMAGLPEGYELAVAIVQHRAKESSELCALLQMHTPLIVSDVTDKQPIEPGHVYVAPPDYHLLVEPGFFSLSTEAPVKYSRPSIDVMFESASDAYRNRLVGVVLTGANDDGARGLQRIVAAGGIAVAQDPATAESFTMPAAAIRAAPSARVLTLQGIGEFLAEFRSAPEPVRRRQA